MILRDLIRDVFRTLWAHKLRTLLTMFGIAWGVVSIVLMTAAGEGLRVGQAKQAETLGRDVMIVFHGRSSLQVGGQRAGRQIHWVDTDVAAVAEESERLPEYVIPSLRQNEIRSHTSYNAAAFLVTGSLPPFAYIRSLDAGEGASITGTMSMKGDAWPFSARMQATIRKPPAVGQLVYLNDTPYAVIGVMAKKKQDSSYDGWDVNKIFIPFTTMRRDFPDKPPGTPFTFDQLLVMPKSVEQHESCKTQLRRALGRLHNFDSNDKEACPIWDTVQEAKAFRTMTDGMKYFLGAVGVVTLFLGGLGVMNVMLVAVRERTREIGVRKALGAPSGSILKQFFIEALMIALVSGGTGLAIAFGLCALVNLIPMPDFFAGLLPTWQTGVVAILLLGMIAVISALYPARRAASIDPIEALRYEAGG
jgi:putative ABC transport system permease protein